MRDLEDLRKLLGRLGDAAGAGIWLTPTEAVRAYLLGTITQSIAAGDLEGARAIAAEFLPGEDLSAVLDAADPMAAMLDFVNAQHWRP